MDNSFLFFSNSSDYEDYISKWMDGLFFEITYWNDFIHEKIEKKYISIKNESSKKVAILNYEDSSYLEQEISCIQNNSSVLDVGCGAIPIYANLIKKKKISFYSIDLLANVYKNIYSDLNIEISELPKLGIVEDISSIFSQNTFDYVHISNSLDHSFDPIIGIWQMLYVCKIGGKIILRHNCNEAEREKHSGLHQWNIDINDDKFVIWRNNTKYDIAKMLEGYAIVENSFLTKLKSNSKIGVNFAVIKKIALSPLYKNPYINQLTVNLLSEYSLKLYDNMFHEKEILYSLLKAGFSFDTTSFDNIYIYGAGFYGKCVYRVLKKIGIKVEYIFDQNIKVFYDSIKVVPYSSEKVKDNACIIIASIAYKDEIESLLLKDLTKKKFKYIKLSNLKFK